MAFSVKLYFLFYSIFIFYFLIYTEKKYIYKVLAEFFLNLQNLQFPGISQYQENFLAKCKVFPLKRYRNIRKIIKSKKKS